MYSDIPSDILSGKYSGILSSSLASYLAFFRHSIWHLFWHFFWHSIQTFFLAFYSDILSDIPFSHSNHGRHLFWHCFWRSIWHEFGPTRHPQHPALTVWSSGPGSLHSILRSGYGCRVHTPSTASWAPDMEFQSRHGPLGGDEEKEEEYAEKKGRRKGEVVAPLLKSREPQLAGGERERERGTTYPTNVMKLLVKWHWKEPTWANIEKVSFPWCSLRRPYYSEKYQSWEDMCTYILHTHKYE